MARGITAFQSMSQRQCVDHVAKRTLLYDEDSLMGKIHDNELLQEVVFKKVVLSLVGQESGLSFLGRRDACPTINSP
jgi:hypothetical protein